MWVCVCVCVYVCVCVCVFAGMSQCSVQAISYENEREAWASTISHVKVFSTYNWLYETLNLQWEGVQNPAELGSAGTGISRHIVAWQRSWLSVVLRGKIYIVVHE